MINISPHLEETVGLVVGNALWADAETAIQAECVLLVLSSRLVKRARIEELLCEQSIEPVGKRSQTHHVFLLPKGESDAKIEARTGGQGLWCDGITLAIIIVICCSRKEEKEGQRWLKMGN